MGCMATIHYNYDALGRHQIVIFIQVVSYAYPWFGLIVFFCFFSPMVIFFSHLDFYLFGPLDLVYYASSVFKTAFSLFVLINCFSYSDHFLMSFLTNFSMSFQTNFARMFLHFFINFFEWDIKKAFSENGFVYLGMVSFVENVLSTREHS